MSEQETTQQLTAPETPETGIDPVVSEPQAVPPAPVRPEGTTPKPEPREPKSSRPWIIALVALLLVIASSGVTYFVMAQDEGTDAGEVTSPVAESSEQDPGTATPIVPGEEPVADAAAVILPSVVQIQTGNGVGSGVIYDANG